MRGTCPRVFSFPGLLSWFDVQMLWLISFGLFYLFFSLGITPFLSGNSFAGVSLIEVYIDE